MRIWLVCAAVAAAVMVALPLPAWALVYRAGNSVVLSEAVADDVYAAGSSVTVNAAVDGDVVAATGLLELDGEVSGGVLAAGGTLRIGRPIGRSLRAFGGTVAVDSRIGGDAVLAGGSLNVGPAGQIGRDLAAAGGTVSLFGSVGRNALIGGGDVIIGGKVEGDAQIQANHITLLPSARIGGKLRYSAEQAIDIQPGAEVSGGTERVPKPPRPRGAAAPFGGGLGFWGRAAEGVGLLVLGLVAFGIMPQGTSQVVSEVGGRFWRSFLTGFVLSVVVPVAAAILLITIIGIPLSAVLILLYLATLYPGQIFVAAWLGTRVLSAMRRGSRAAGQGSGPASVRLALVVGTLVLVLLFAIPIGGWIFRGAALLVGFGALWRVIWEAAASRPAPQVAPPPTAP